MKVVTIERPHEWTHANLYGLADLHIGDPNCRIDLIKRYLKDIENDPNAVVVLNGDFMNTAVRNSVSDVYGDIMTPQQQCEYVADILDPIRDKIVGATTGNHEFRTHKDDGLDITRMALRELGKIDLYDPNGLGIVFKFGSPNQKAHHNKSGYMAYSIYMTHGIGGGRKEGAKAIRMGEMARICDADIYIHAHTHLPMAFKENFGRIDLRTGKYTEQTKTFVNLTAWLQWGGYGQSHEYVPGAIANPLIRLDGSFKQTSVTI